MKFKYLSSLSLFLSLFVLVISFLFYQIYQFSTIRNASFDYTKLSQDLILTDSKINAILQQKFTYINADRLNSQLATFEDQLEVLKNHNINKLLPAQAQNLYQNLHKEFQEKRLLSEDFKSSNASMLNSVHYLFDLENQFQNSSNITIQTKHSVNYILFSIMNLALNLEINYTPIYAEIDKLKSLYQEDSNLINYSIHSQLALTKTIDLLNISKELSSLKIQDNIQTLQNKFEINYNQSREVQVDILIIIFILLLISTLLLFFSYRNTQKIVIELSSFKFAVEHSDNTVVITDANRNITYANENFEKTTGYSIGSALGKNPNILKSGKMDESFYRDLNETLDSGEKWTGEFINKKEDGSLYYEKASIVPIFIKKKLVSYLAIKLDITPYVLQKKKLQLSAAVFEHTMDGIMITDADAHIITINNALLKMTGYSEEQLIGKNPNILQSGQQDELFYKNMWEQIEKHGSWKGKIFNRTKDGLLTQTWLSISSIKDDKGEILNYIAIHTDLNELILIQEKINHMAYHDALTKLPNRRYMEEHLEKVIYTSSRENRSFSVIFLDLDRFKIINDTLGHNIGDKLLITVANRISKVLRQSDILTRMGGDEFIIISQNIKNKKEPARISHKILKILHDPIELEGHTLNISASIGISIYPDDASDNATLIKHADNAMYHAKELGKNNFQYFTQKLSEDVHQRLHLEQALQGALKNRELYLHYQPQYDLKSRKIVAAEALLRWDSPELGFIPPDKFIPIAEETHLIIPIGEFVFEEACKAFLDWRTHCLDIEIIAINVSSIQLAHPNILQTFTNIIKRVGIPANNIEIEITERYIYDYLSSGSTILDDLQKFGFRISIDDFGTGYSSMSYLKKLPLDTIKIDKSFIDDIPHDNNDVEITKAIMALSTSLGYSNVAEGIETKEQEDFLREHGCKTGQGYYFQRPISYQDFISFCKNCV